MSPDGPRRARSAPPGRGVALEPVRVDGLGGTRCRRHRLVDVSTRGVALEHPSGHRQRRVDLPQLHPQPARGRRERHIPARRSPRSEPVRVPSRERTDPLRPVPRGRALHRQPDHRSERLVPRRVRTRGGGRRARRSRIGHPTFARRGVRRALRLPALPLRPGRTARGARRLLLGPARHTPGHLVLPRYVAHPSSLGPAWAVGLRGPPDGSASARAAPSSAPPPTPTTRSSTSSSSPVPESSHRFDGGICADCCPAPSSAWSWRPSPSPRSCRPSSGSARHPDQVDASLRPISDLERYGLHLSQLVVPDPHHQLARSPGWAPGCATCPLRARSVPTWGSFALVGMLFALLVRLPRVGLDLSDRGQDLRLSCAVLGVVAFAWGTVGGLGLTVGLGFTQIRNWSPPFRLHRRTGVARARGDRPTEARLRVADGSACASRA